jgi:4'-phosphopantetheinyl transferase
MRADARAAVGVAAARACLYSFDDERERTMSAGAARQRAAALDLSGWSDGPLEPALGDGELHVWCAELASVDEQAPALLSERERERAARIASAEAGAQWARSRGVLRALLGRYLHCDPRALALGVGAHGKLELGDGAAAHGKLAFNLSHSESIALYAFTSAGSVGIDVQLALSASSRRASARVRDHVALALRVFGEQQAQRLSAIEEPDREREFLRLWTRYEAELKRVGVGVAAGTVAPAQAPWIAELELGDAAAAAVACELAPRELRRWKWR